MDKRVDRNQELYKQVNEKIRERAQKNSNEEFKNTQNTLKNINPQLFGNQEEKIVEEKKIVNKNQKKIIIGIVLISVLIILVIIIAVVISIWKRKN